MAFEYDGGVMLASDTRTSQGSLVAYRSADKIIQLAKNICACKCGSAADTQFILMTIGKYLSGFAMEYQGTIPVKVACSLISQLLYRYKG